MSELGSFLESVRKGGGPIQKLQCGTARAWIDTSGCTPHEADQLAGIAKRPPRGMSLYKFGSRSLVGSYILTVGDPAVLKYYYPRGIHKHIGYGINGSRAYQSWLAGLAFNYLGIASPPPLVVADWSSMGGLWLEKSFLATRQAIGQSLFEWVDDHAEDRDRIVWMADQLRGVFSRMADHHVSHGDLKANNLIVAEDGSVSLIDLDAAEVGTASAKWRGLRERDAYIFLDNWRDRPAVAKVFSNLF